MDYHADARLTIGESVIAVTEFALEAAENGLGMQLDATIAPFTEPVDSNLISPGTPAEISFEIGAAPTSTLDWAMMIDSARVLSSRARFLPQAADVISFTAMDSISDKWEIAPRQSHILYDPLQVDIVTASTATRDDALDENGDPIEPVLMSITGYDLIQLMQFVYVDSLGFTEIITNIETYPIQLTVIPLTATFHSAVISEISAFQPVFVPDEAGRLWILDPQGTLPDGFDAVIRNIPLIDVLSLEMATQKSGNINAVLLTTQDRTVSAIDAGTVVDRIDPEENEIGTFGEPGWQKTIILNHYKDFFDDPDNPTRATRTDILWRIDAHTYARVGALVREIMTETQVNTFKYDFRLRTGYTKTTNLLTRLPADDTLLMRTAEIETNQIIYEEFLSTPDDKRKQWELTEIVGTVLSVENPDDPTKPIKTSLRDATEANDFPEDADVLNSEPISTTISRWRHIGRDQIEVSDIKTNHLTNTTKSNRNYQHVGTVDVRLGAGAGSVTMLLRDLTSEAEIGARVPFSLNAGNIPINLAQPLAERILARQGGTPRRFTIEFKGFDLSMQRGSLRRVFDRAGTPYVLLITGYSFRGRFGPMLAEIFQTATGIVLDTVT